MSVPSDPALRARKLRDASIILPLAGLILLMPPVAAVFALPAHLAGVPLAVAYVFLVWAVLILGARLIGRRLQSKDAGASR